MSATQAAPEDYMTAEEVSALLRVTVTTLYNWRTKRPRRGPRGTRIGRALLYRREGVQAWLAEREAIELARETGQA